MSTGRRPIYGHMNTLIFGCYNLHIVYSWWTLITDLISDPSLLESKGVAILDADCIPFSRRWI